MAGGRPPKLTKEQRAEVLKAFEQYIDRTADPTIAGFCVWDTAARRYSVTKDNIQDWKEFSSLRKLATAKQEEYLLQGATRGQLNASVSIFRLKQPQHGYTDKTQTELTAPDGLFGNAALTVKVVDGRSGDEESKG